MTVIEQRALESVARSLPRIAAALEQIAACMQIEHATTKPLTNFQRWANVDTLGEWHVNYGRCYKNCPVRDCPYRNDNPAFDNCEKSFLDWANKTEGAK